MASSGIQSRLEQEKQVPPQLQRSPGFGAWLNSMGGSVVFSTYQSAQVFFLSADSNDQTFAPERIVGSTMGLAVDHDKLWTANKEQAWRFLMSDRGPWH
jgi:hypothetical protein